MSGGCELLKAQEDDITKMLAATTHIGSENSETTMEQYIFKRRQDGVNIINLKKTWEKLMLSARCIAAVETPADVFVVSSRPYGQRAVLKFARYIGATPIAGRFTPGAFTNQIQAAFKEPRLLVIADPRADHQPITEASYANIPIVGFCNVDSPTKFVDMAIPCNNKSAHSIGLMFWFLSREVLRLRGVISREIPWEVMPDLFFYRDPEEAEKEEAARQETLAQAQAAQQAPPAKAEAENWGGEGGDPVTDWANEPAMAPVAAAIAPGPPMDAGPPQMVPAQPKYQVQEDWNPSGAVAAAAAAPAPVAPGVSDWAAESEPVQQQQQPPPPQQQPQQWGGGAGGWQ